MRLFTLSLIAATAVSLLLTACMPESRSGSVYTRDQARASHSVYYGTVLRVNEVTIEGTQTGAGTIAGGAMGGVLGSAIGKGTGRSIATVGGAVLGAAGGAAAEKKMTTVAGLEIEVELDDGEILLVVQEKDDDYRVGDRVRVVRGPDGSTRVRQ